MYGALPSGTRHQSSALSSSARASDSSSTVEEQKQHLLPQDSQHSMATPESRPTQEQEQPEEEELEVEDVWVADVGVKVEGSDTEIIDLRFYQSVVAECLATGLFQIFLVLAWMAPSSLPLTDLGVVRLALTVGSAFFVLLFIFQSVSGGHITPAITLGLLLSKKITVNRAAFYFVAQLVGALIGTAICQSISPTAFSRLKASPSSASSAAGMGPNRLHGMTLGGAVGAEITGAVLVVMAVLFAKDTNRAIFFPHIKILGALAVSLALATAYLGLVPLTSASISPAQSFALAVSTGQWSSHWVFWLSPLLGAAAASLVHKTLFTTVIIELNPALGT